MTKDGQLNEATQMDYKQLFANPDRFNLVPYTNTFYVSSLAAGAPATGLINVEASSPFIWEKTAYFADIAGAAQTDSSRVIPLITMQLTESGSGQLLFDQAQPLATIAGSEGLPLFTAQPYLFRPASNISALFTNYSAATTYANIYVTLIGYRVFQYTDAARVSRPV